MATTTPDAAAELRLRSLIANATGARQRATAHTIWAVSRLEGIGPGGSSSSVVEIAGTYTRDGAGVSQRLAYSVRRDVVSCLGLLVDPMEADTIGATLPERKTGRWGGLLVLGLPELAAARAVARWAIETGAMVEPVLTVEETPTGLSIPGQPKLRGVTRCPCGGHAHDDTSPSGLYDIGRRRFSCLATGARFTLSKEAEGWRLGTRRKVAGEAVNTIEYPTGPAQGSWPHSGLTVLGSLGPGMLWRSSDQSWRAIFERAERVGNGENATAEAWARAWEGEIAASEGRTPARQHEDQLISMDAWKIIWAKRYGRLVPTDKMSLGVGRVLMDLDQLDPALLSSSDWTALAERLDEVVRSSSLFDCAESMVETSARGLQLIARLDGFFWSSEDFHRSPAVRVELKRVGELLLALVDRGGHLDPSAFAPGRYGRLPGIRIKDGFVEHAHLRWVGEERAVDNVVDLDAARRARSAW